MPKLNGELDKRCILAILASFLLCSIVSWWLSDLLKTQNNRFKPTSDSCDSPAVSKSDRQASNFICKLRPKPLLNNCAHLLPTMCAVMLIGRFGSNQLAMVWTIKPHFRSLNFYAFLPIRARTLKRLKSQPNLCPIWSNLMYYGFFLCVFFINHTCTTEELFIFVGPRMPFRFHQCQYRLLIVNSISLLIRSLNRKKISFKILKTKLSLVAPF